MLRADPTRTTMLRRAFARGMVARVRAVQAFTRTRIVTANAFAAGPLALNAGVWGALPANRQISEFKAWFTELVGLNLLSDWAAPYVQQSRTRGAERAYSQVHRLPRNPAVTAVASADFRRAVIVGRAGQAQFNLLYEQVYNTLEGVTDRLRKDVAQEVARGITAKETPEVIQARIDGVFTKAVGIWTPEFTNTAVTLGHAEGQLDAFGWMGVQRVGAIVEWYTTGNPCPRCAALEGTTYTIEEAHGLIPLHKNCKCAWGLPLIRSL